MEGGVTLHPSSSPGGGPTEEDETGANAVRFPAMALSEQQEMFLPIVNISRIMKRVLPANAKIRKEAKESVQECVTEFIGFITSEANDKCLRDKRKTINGDDIIWAMTTLGFDNYVEPLTVYFQRFKEMEGDPRASGGSPSGPEALSRSPNKGPPSSPDIQH